MTVVVVAPDSFKGCLPAYEAAAALATGVRAGAAALGRPVEVRARPVADGGEGSLEVVIAAGWEPHALVVSGPTGTPVRSRFAVSPAGHSPRTALVELAAASGLTLLPGARPDPLNAGTYGTGELVSAALDSGAERLVLAIGGSATTDGGAGMLQALGVRFLDAQGDPLPPGGAALQLLDRIDSSGIDPRLAAVEVVVACDVDNPLTGAQGAAHVYAPQKGASPQDVTTLDAGLRRWAEVVRRDLGADVDSTPGAGAAGGVGAAALAFLGARLTPGIDLLLDLAGFDAALDGAALVLTGEGCFDAQTLRGKAPVGVARRARQRGIPVVVIAGRISLTGEDHAAMRRVGIARAYPLLDLEPDPDRACRHAASLLHEAASRVVREMLRDGTDPSTPLAARSSP